MLSKKLFNRSIQVSEAQKLLFTWIGQAIINIQVLEECLNRSITLNVDVGYPSKILKVEAEKRFQQRSRKHIWGMQLKKQKLKIYMQMKFIFIWIRF